MTAPTLFDDNLGDLPIALQHPGRGGFTAKTEVPAAAPRATHARVVGIDPSLTGTGIAYDTGLCYRVGRTGITTLPLAQRLAAVDELVEQIVRHTDGAELVVIESPAFSRKAGGAVERHALWWLTIRALTKLGTSLAVVGPMQRPVYAAGKGSASKAAVVDAVARRLPMFVTGGDENLADAAVLCAMGCDHLGVPLAKMPAAHRAILDKISWPDGAS